MALLDTGRAGANWNSLARGRVGTLIADAPQL